MNRLGTTGSIALLVVAVAVSMASSAASQGKRPLAASDLYKLGWISSLAVAPEGNLAAFVVKTYDMDENTSAQTIWLADFAKGTVKRLTTPPKGAADFAPAWMSGTRLAFVSTRSGSPQIWAIDLGGGEAVQVTDLPVPVNGFAVAPDGKHAAVHADVFPDCATMACNKDRAAAKEQSKVKARLYDKLLYRIWDTWRDEQRGHVLWVSLDGGEPRDLTPGEWQAPPLDLGGSHDLAISPDGATVAFTANVSENPAWNTNNDVFLVPAGGGTPTNLTKDNAAVDSEPVFSPSGKFLAYLAMKRPGFEADRRVINLYNLATGKTIPLTDTLDRSVEEFSFAPDSKSILFNAWDRGHLAIFRVSVPSGIVTKLVAEHTNRTPQYSADLSRIVYLSETVAGPPELAVASASGERPQVVSHVNDALLFGISMGTLEEFEYQGALDEAVHGFLLKPPGFDPKKKYPLLVLIHGGPQGSFGDDFHQRWNMQMFATPGFVVAAINFHGSTGYGQKFTDAVSGDWGGAPYEDIMKGIDALVAQKTFIDKDDVSAAGASYGGFMINWILGHTDRFRSLVSHDGVFDQESMYGSTEELWFPEWEMRGTPWTNAEEYQKTSPSSYVPSFKTPTLVVHGEHDYRVPYTQGLALFTALQRQGVESKLLFFPDENHFVRKPQNARLWWNTVLEWLAHHAGLKWIPPEEAAHQNALKAGVKKIAR